MLEVNCTERLRKLLGVDVRSHSMSVAETTTLGDWYANIFDVEYDPDLYEGGNESYLLMINTDSLLSFYVHIPEELPLEIFVAELPGYVESCFLDNGFTSRQMKFLLPNLQHVVISKATDRTMLGYLRAFAHDYENQIVRETPYRFEGSGEIKCNRVKWKNQNDMPRKGLLKPTAKMTARYLVSTAVRRTT